MPFDLGVVRRGDWGGLECIMFDVGESEEGIWVGENICSIYAV